MIFRDFVKIEDIECVKNIVESTGFFYDIEVPIAIDLVKDTFEGGQDYKFLFVEFNDETIAYTCYGLIDGTVGGYDLYWIVTHNDYRDQGIGKKLLEETHLRVKNDGGRYIVAETSSIEKYLPTRKFYENNQYNKEAIIRDFYRIGDDKIIYVKYL